MIARDIIVRGSIKRVYISNTYYIYEPNDLFKDNNEINRRSLLVYKKGSHLYDKTLKYGMIKNFIRYETEIYCFIEKEKGNTLYILLTDIIDVSERTSFSTKMNIPSDYYAGDYWLINTHEAFMEYARVHEYEVCPITNNLFFSDFRNSLFSLDFDGYLTDEYHDFFTVQNHRDPDGYFHFIVFERHICLTDYKYYN